MEDDYKNGVQIKCLRACGVEKNCLKIRSIVDCFE